MLPRAIRRIRGRTPSLDYEERVFLVLPRATTRSEFQQATPSTFRQAEASPHATFWCFTRKREVISHHKNSTLGLCSPSRRQGIRSSPQLSSTRTSTLVMMLLCPGTFRILIGRREWW